MSYVIPLIDDIVKYKNSKIIIRIAYLSSLLQIEIPKNTNMEKIVTRDMYPVLWLINIIYARNINRKPPFLIYVRIEFIILWLFL